jgi:hypothetical protein
MILAIYLMIKIIINECLIEHSFSSKKHKSNNVKKYIYLIKELQSNFFNFLLLNQKLF